MECIVFSTHRRIRDFVAAHDNTLLPKLYTMDEFLRRTVVVPGRVFVDEASRVLYLYRAIETLDISRLGFDKNFLSFVKNSEFVFRFFEELHAEQVPIEKLKEVDLYAEYEEHLQILQAIFQRYTTLLEKEGLVDRAAVGAYRLNEKFLRQFERIDIHVDGYLSRFETGVLERIETPLFLHFVTTPFNSKLIERLGLEESVATNRRCTLDWRRKVIVEEERLPALRSDAIDLAAFEERIDQVAYVLRKVEAFIEAGADPDRVAVILPDEDFAEYLKLFDPLKNFNFAMGTPFVQSRYYRRLADLYDALADRSASAKEKMAKDELTEAFSRVSDFTSFLAFLQEVPMRPQELEAIDEALFSFKKFGPLLGHATPLQLLHTWLQRLEPLSLDDVGGGRITVMGLLESRGKTFDGVVIVDFNEEVVPKVSEKDLFLNSAIRRHAGMPTRKDKENLQKNYYYRLLQNSGRAALCCVRNEESLPSRFLAELGLGDPTVENGRYRAIIAPRSTSPVRYAAPLSGPNPFRSKPELTPTKLKDWLECPRRFHYRYLLEIRSEREEEKVVGTLIHEALEAAALSKTELLSPEGYFEFLIDHIYRGSRDILQRFEISLTWEERLERFCRADYDELLSFHQVALEEWIEVTYGGFRLSSRADRIDLGEDVVRLIDYKTTKHLDKTLSDANDFQLLFYWLWAKETFPGHRVEAIYYDLYNVKKQKIDLHGKAEELDRVLAVLNERETFDYPMTDDLKMCRYCDYKTACGRE
ncbi:PD-(D/E)XK nuclease family protein [Hydrogenimonas urashimensis]|uniref:PD-(D/E)XK nuclease family protein n=1 Tax=Hydrogenimonas urashimensis TaxID=2740515 RepID=UPI001916707F|nr:PD-(D/E)XK nuclease family protein [Hydrogenimonas urashimensis]